LLKQSSFVKCVCGQDMNFPEGEIKAKCPCGTIWECGPEGYWYTQTPVSFTPFTELMPIAKSCRYEKYMERRSKGKKRKGGRRC